MSFKYDDKKGDVRVYFGDKIQRISKDDLSKMKKYPHVFPDSGKPNPYTLIPCDEKSTLTQTYIDFCTFADELKLATNGWINCYKTETDTKTAKELFNRYTKTIIPDVIEQDEAEWIENMNMGSMIWADYYKGPAYYYDITSEYPSIM